MLGIYLHTRSDYVFSTVLPSISLEVLQRTSVSKEDWSWVLIVIKMMISRNRLVKLLKTESHVVITDYTPVPVQVIAFHFSPH